MSLKSGLNRYFCGPLWIETFFFQLVFFFFLWQLQSPKEQMRIAFHRWEIISPSSNISPLDIPCNWRNIGKSPIELIPTLAGQLQFTCYILKQSDSAISRVFKMLSVAERYSYQMGHYNSINIYWSPCSSKGNISFLWTNVFNLREGDTTS